MALAESTISHAAVFPYGANHRKYRADMPRSI